MSNSLDVFYNEWDAITCRWLAQLTQQGELPIGKIGSDAGTVSSGRLNPAHSRWLMGYPKAWCEAALQAWKNTP